MMDNLKHIVESLLFVTEAPLPLERFREILPEASPQDIRQALNELAAEYEARQGGFLLCEVAGGFQLRSRPEYSSYIQRLVEPSPLRLSRAALETLAIIAYKQPIIRNDIEHIRGVDSGGVLRMLLERKLIRVLGRRDIPGRPMIYATTKRFLELFELKDLKDLPTPREIEALGQPGADPEADAPAFPPDGPSPEPPASEGRPADDPAREEESPSEPPPAEDTPDPPSPRNNA